MQLSFVSFVRLPLPDAALARVATGEAPVMLPLEVHTPMDG